MFDIHVKLAKYLSLIILAMVLIGCVAALPQSETQKFRAVEPVAPDTQIFFRVLDRDKDTVELWERTVGTTRQFPRMILPAQYPAVGLPIQELAILQRKYCSIQPDDCSIQDLSLQFSLGVSNLSPDKEWLALGESALWCPGTRCYGVTNLVIWNVNREERRVLIEMPISIDEIAANGIGNIAWSPNSKEIGFIHFSVQNNLSRVRVIDIDTKIIRDIGEGFRSIAWSPDGEQLAFFTRDGVTIASKDGVVLNTMDDGYWVQTTGIDWSPDGSKLVIIAATEEVWKEDKASIYIADLMAGSMAEINVALDGAFRYSEPKWSSDGRLIGVNITSDEQEFLNGLVLFDPEDGTIKASLMMKRRQTRWQWSTDGDAILLPIDEEISIFYWQEDRLENLPPPIALEEGIRNGNIHISSPVW